MRKTILQIDDLHKKYHRGAQANDGISLEVKAGQVVGLLGHNGAGKTTLVNQIVGLIKPDSGTIMLDGIDAVAHPDKARELASVQAQTNAPITGLAPKTAIELVAMMRGATRTQAELATKRLIDKLDLTPWANTPSQKISGGIARLTSFAMTASVPSKLVILDEPTNDVDPIRRRYLWKQIRELADQGAAVLLVTHNVREAEQIVDRLVILDQGKVIAQGTVSELVGTQEEKLTISVDTLHQLDWPGYVTLSRHNGNHHNGTVLPQDGERIIHWATEARNKGLIERYSLTPTSLEDVYFDLVGTEQNEIAA